MTYGHGAPQFPQAQQGLLGGRAHCLGRRSAVPRRCARLRTRAACSGSALRAPAASSVTIQIARSSR
eukprot:393146-Alexandrium_andersonii.AAC.1